MAACAAKDSKNRQKPKMRSGRQRNLSFGFVMIFKSTVLERPLRQWVMRIQKPIEARSALNVAFKKDFMLSVLGLAFLWPCLIPTTYYSAISRVLDDTGLAGYPTHIAYPTFLTIALAMMVVLARFRPTALPRSRFALLIAGLGGAGGHAVLLAPGSFGLMSPVVVTAAFLLIAAYVAVYVPVFGAWISNSNARTAGCGTALSFLIWEAAAIPFQLLGADQSIVLVICPFFSVALVLLRPTPVGCSAAFRLEQIRDIPWHIALLGIVFIFFDVIYIKILFAQMPGTASFQHFLTSMVALAVIGIVCVALAVRRYSENTLVAIFAFLVILYMAALLTVLLLSDSSFVFDKRLWAASGRCFKVFVMIVVAVAVSKGRLSATAAFSLAVLAMVAVPNFISFDQHYDSPVLYAIAQASISNTIALLASFSAASIAIVFLVLHSFKIAKESAAGKANWQKALCESALEGFPLTATEKKVSYYLSKGYGAQMVAEQLHLSVSTVYTHTKHIYRKLGISSKQEFISLINSKDSSE
jgi:DNA-binding CsgD family transcriptional regulator